MEIRKRNRDFVFSLAVVLTSLLQIAGFHHFHGPEYGQFSE